MRRLLWLTPILILAAVAACGGDDDDGATESPGASQTIAATPSGEPTAEPGSPTSIAVDCTANAEVAAEGEITWDIAPDEIPAPDGYEVQDAEGDAPLLEVLKDGGAVGGLELLRFGLPDNLDPALGFNGLENWANDFYDSVGTERELSGLTLEPDTPEPISFGEYCGAAYGYTVRNDDGDVVERYIGVATYDPDNIYLIISLYDEVNPETSWASVEDIEAYGPSLRELAAEVDFPPD